MIQNVSFSGPLWHVVYVEPRSEASVVADVGAELGFKVYAPMERHWSIVRGRKVEAARPLFPRYIFAAVDPYKQGWQDILDIEGVIDVLGRPNHNDFALPSYVPSSWIEAMRKAEAAGVFDRTKNNASQFKEGERVRVEEGPFTGFEALIEKFIAKMRSTTARKRAKVLVGFMNQMIAIEIDVAALGKL